MRPDDPLAALRAIPQELSDTRTALENLQEEVQEDRRTIWWLRWACAVIAVAALVAIGWTAYQQTVLDAKSAVIDRLAYQNAAAAARDARNAHDLCLRLNRSRAVIVGVWEKVLSERPDDAKLIPRVQAAEPLGRCPKG